MWLDNLLIFTPIIMIAIALLLACALRVVCRRRSGPEGHTGASRAADDPYFFPIGECTAIPNYRRHLDERDFRAWGVPSLDRRKISAGALRRVDGDGRLSASLSSETSAVVLPFRGRRG